MIHVYFNPEAPEPEPFDFYEALRAWLEAERPKRPKRVIDPEALRSKALLTLDEAAMLLSVSRRTVNNLITVPRRGDRPRLRTVREPNSKIVRVTRADLDAYIAMLRAEAGIHTSRSR